MWSKEFQRFAFQAENWRILLFSALVPTSKSIFKTTISLSQVQQPKYGEYGDIWLCAFAEYQ